MFKLVVLSALLAVAAAAPSLLPLAYSHVAAPALSIPTAVSHQSRTDVISKPVISTYAAAPVAVAAAPVAVAAPAVAYSHPAVAVPSAVSHQSRTDVYSKPVVSAALTYAAPHLSYAAPHLSYAAPVAYGNLW